MSGDETYPPPPFIDKPYFRCSFIGKGYKGNVRNEFCIFLSRRLRTDRQTVRILKYYCYCVENYV